MKEGLVIYRLARYLGNTIAFLLRHQTAIAATTMFVIAFSAAYYLFRQHMGMTYSLLCATGVSLLVGALALIRSRDYWED